MKMKTNRLVMVLAAVAGLLASTCFADLGLAGLIEVDGGATLAGQAVSAAAKAVYAGNTDPAVIEAELAKILNEAEATGSEQVMRYAIVAVMAAGGNENIETGKAAVDNSLIWDNHQSLAAMTTAQAALLMKGAGKSQDRSKQGSDDTGKKGGDQGKGGGDKKADKSIGGGTGNGYTFDLDLFFKLLDQDLPATGV